MVNLTDEQKKLFYTGGNFKDYVFYFPEIDFSITNETLHQESVTIKEAICEAEEFTLGGCIASSIEFEVSEIVEQDLNGLEFTAELYVNLKEDGTYDLKMPMGKYRVESAKMVDDKDYKKVVAYDALYDASVDVSEWHNSYFSSGSHTIKEAREALLKKLEIPFVKINAINDSFSVKKSKDYEKGTLQGTEVLRALCTLSGGFGKINREGYFELNYANEFALYPEETLYPEEDLYPEDREAYLGGAVGDEDVPDYITTKYEEYITRKATCLFIQNESETAKVGSDESNPYILNNNFLLYGKSESELKNIGQKIFESIKNVFYRPNTTTLGGLPYVETGDAFGLIKRRDIIESFVFSRTLSGVQALRDTYESKGRELRANELSVIDKINQLEEKDTSISGDLNDTIEDLGNTKEELSDFEEKTKVRFESTDESIEAEVSRATKAEGDLSSRITITADEISAEVTRAMSAENNLSSRITMTANDITAEVSRATAAEGNLSSRITINANGISTKVEKGNVVSEINQSPDRIVLNSNRLVVNSSNFTLDESGNATFSGVLNGASGEFKGSLSATLTKFSCLISDDGRVQLQGMDNPLLYMNGGSIYLTYPGHISTRTVCGQSSLHLLANENGNKGVSVEELSSTLRPIFDGSMDCGSPSGRWDNIYARNGQIQTSDKKEKKNISEMKEEFARDIIEGTIPKTYKFINGNSGRTHAGMIAQDVEEQLISTGITSNGFAGFIKYEKEEDGIPTGEFGYGLRYEEYIAPIIKYCQMLKKDLQKEREERQRLQFSLMQLQGEFSILKERLQEV